MSHRVTVRYTSGSTKTFIKVADIEHFPSALVVLVFEDGTRTLIRNFEDIQVIDVDSPGSTTLRD